MSTDTHLQARAAHLVLDDEDALSHSVLLNWARVGSSIWKIEPLPSVDTTQIRPTWGLPNAEP